MTINNAVFKRNDLVRVDEAHSLDDYPFYAKIIAIADGYAMLRKPYAAPFVRSIKELERLNRQAAIT